MGAFMRALMVTGTCWRSTRILRERPSSRQYVNMADVSWWGWAHPNIVPVWSPTPTSIRHLFHSEASNGRILTVWEVRADRIVCVVCEQSLMWALPVLWACEASLSLCADRARLTVNVPTWRIFSLKYRNMPVCHGITHWRNRAKIH